MECNKYEAKKAMDLAKRKITEKDFNGAKVFAEKAQDLFPNHDGLSQLLTTIEVYLSGETKIDGEADWYNILGVDPVHEVLKKQYCKLALMIHPDINKCKGAEGAFQLLSGAWSRLSDTSKRLLYNKKRGLEPPLVSSEKNENPIIKIKCHKCRVYVNLTSFCSNCRVSFFEEEITPPSPSRRAYSNSQNARNEAANVVQQAEDTSLKRGFEESRETDAARGSTESYLRSCKRPETDGKHQTP